MDAAADTVGGAQVSADALRAYVDYLRDLGIYDLIARDVPSQDASLAAWSAEHLRPRVANAPKPTVTPLPSAGKQSAPTNPARPAPPAERIATPFEQANRRAAGVAASTSTNVPQPLPRASGPEIVIASPLARAAVPARGSDAQTTAPQTDFSTEPFGGFDRLAAEMPAPTSFNKLAPMPATRLAVIDRPAALTALRAEIGDCTRCPLAYAGRHSIVFGDGDAAARLMFVGEGPGADEDASGLPFVGKAGQLLNNMIGAMGLRREQVYIANVVKCRPPKNRAPEPVEANTCSPFLLRQIDIVQPEVIVALGGTAAMYLLGVKQSIASLRGQWFDVRGAKCAVTYHPAFLLRDPRQKGEAWKDLQRVMGELGLKPPARA